MHADTQAYRPKRRLGRPRRCRRADLCQSRPDRHQQGRPGCERRALPAGPATPWWSPSSTVSPAPCLTPGPSTTSSPPVRSASTSVGRSTTRPMPFRRLLFNVLAMVAEFESDLIRLRTREAIKVAKAKGHLRGVQPKLNRRQEAHLVSLMRSGEYSTAEADLFGEAARPSTEPSSGSETALASALQPLPRPAEINGSGMFRMTSPCGTQAAHPPYTARRNLRWLGQCDDDIDVRSRPSTRSASSRSRVV